MAVDSPILILFRFVYFADFLLFLLWQQVVLII